MTTAPEADALSSTVRQSESGQRKIVFVAPRMRGELLRYDGRSGRYRLHDYDRRCALHKRGCPSYAVRVIGATVSEPVYLSWQAYRQGAWRLVREWKRSTTDYRAQVELAYTRGDIGVPMRIRARFLGDWEQIESASTWAYFKVMR